MSDDVFGAGDGGIPGVRDATKHPREKHSTGHHTPNKELSSPTFEKFYSLPRQNLAAKKKIQAVGILLSHLESQS